MPYYQATFVVSVAENNTKTISFDYYCSGYLEESGCAKQSPVYAAITLYFRVYHLADTHIKTVQIKYSTSECEGCQQNLAGQLLHSTCTAHGCLYSITHEGEQFTLIG